MTSDRLGLVILAVADVAGATRFYTAAFGWPVAIEVGVYSEFALPQGQRLGLYQREAVAENVGDRLPISPNGGLTATELYFYPDNLPEAIKQITREHGSSARWPGVPGATRRPTLLTLMATL